MYDSMTWQTIPIRVIIHNGKRLGAPLTQAFATF